MRLVSEMMMSSNIGVFQILRFEILTNIVSFEQLDPG